MVSPATNLWHCLGARNVGGSTIDWIMKTRGISFRYAVELLRADHSSLVVGAGRVVRKDTTTKLAAQGHTEMIPLSVSTDASGNRTDWVRSTNP